MSVYRPNTGGRADDAEGVRMSPVVVFVTALGCGLAQLVGHLELVAHAGQAADYENQITYIP
jgi:hypothetical protein